MSSQSSSYKNIDSDNLSYVLDPNTPTSSQKNLPIQQHSQSSSPQVQSSSHDVYETNKKKIKKKKSKNIQNKRKIKNKNEPKHKSRKNSKVIAKKQKNQQNNIQIQQNQNKKRKSQRTLNKFLGKQSQDQNNKEEKKEQKIATFSLHPFEVEYLNRFQMFRCYSLQNIIQEEKIKSKIVNRQKTLDPFVRRQRKRSLAQSQESLDQQDQRTYLKSYVVIKTVLKSMLKSQKVPKFFKLPICDIISNQTQLKFFAKYKKIIDEPLDLQTLDDMVEQKDIKNLMEFEALFNQMITNSYVFHKYVNDQQMIRATFQLQQTYNKMMVELCCPQMNEYPKSSIKTTSFMQRPRSKKVSVEGEDRKIEFMDLDDLVNKHRIKVMNYFLKVICQKNPQNLYTFINRVRNLVHRYPDDRVEIFNDLSNYNNKEGLKQFSLYESRQIPSSRSINSSISQNDEIFQISIQCISVNLFQQLKQLIKSQVRELKRQQNLGEKQQEIIRHILYPHQDSDDFDSDDT